MIGGSLKRGRLKLAGTAALLACMGAVPVSAADLGGDCCADLEERIAELEATTARKGNRKVSLEVSGHVNQGVLWWDDGFESNAGVYTNDNSRTRVRFLGKAKITSDWEAGYRIELGFRTANSKRFNQDDPTGGTQIDIRDSHWYLKSKQLGRVTVGLQSSATDGLTEINQTQTRDFAKYSDVEDTGLGLKLRNTAGAKSGQYDYYQLISVHGDQPGEGEKRFNGISYTTPEFAGFAATAFWGEDDYWDVALNWKGELGPFKVAAGIGYGEIRDGAQTNTACAAHQGTGTAFGPGVTKDADCSQFGGSISVLHEPTGLFVNAGAGVKKDDLIQDITLYSGAVSADDEDTFWSIQAGIEKKWNAFGKTTIYGEYYDYDGGSNNKLIDAGFAGVGAAGTNAAVTSTDLQIYGAGIAQGFDAAALTLYLSYRHVEADLTASALTGSVATGTPTAVDLEDIDIVFGGGIIKF